MFCFALDVRSVQVSEVTLITNNNSNLEWMQAVLHYVV